MLSSRPDPLGQHVRARRYALVGIFAFVFGGLALAAGAYGMYDEVRMQSWQAAQADILVSRVTTDTVGTTVTEYGTRPVTEHRLHVVYSYSTGTQDLRGTTISRRHTTRSVLSDSERYRVGARVPVYFNPQDPNYAVLERPIPSTAVAAASVGALLMLVAVWGYWRQRAAGGVLPRRSDPKIAVVPDPVELRIPARSQAT